MVARTFGGMERRSRLVLFGVGVVVAALFYLLYHAADRSLRLGAERAEKASPAEQATEAKAAPPT